MDIKKNKSERCGDAKRTMFIRSKKRRAKTREG